MGAFVKAHPHNIIFMNKKEYQEKIGELRSQIAELNKEYIESNRVYSDGTKVKVINKVGKVRIGVVRGYIISIFNDDVVPYLKLVTADGKESSRNIVIHPEDKVELAD